MLALLSPSLFTRSANILVPTEWQNHLIFTHVGKLTMFNWWLWILNIFLGYNVWDPRREITNRLVVGFEPTQDGGWILLT